jgi:FkbM family methyltransferase
VYEQGTDVRLLTSLLAQTPCKIVIDAGAERGGFTQAFLDHGAEVVFAIEPYPPNAAMLRERFAAHPRVEILELALSDRDGSAALHVIADREGKNESSYHSLARAGDTALLHTVGEVTVSCRTLDSLVTEGALPPQVGILKIDAEGHDFTILRGLGRLTPSAVMIEFWDDLPDAMGRAQFALRDVREFLLARGYCHCVTVKRHDEFETMEVNDARTRPGDWGNAIFLHESVFPQVPAAIYEAAAAAQRSLVDKAVYFKTHCGLRMQVIEEQGRALEHFRKAAPG